MQKVKINSVVEGTGRKKLYKKDKNWTVEIAGLMIHSPNLPQGSWSHLKLLEFSLLHNMSEHFLQYFPP